jgi:hypothetical protein
MVITCSNGGYFIIKYSVLLIVIGYLEKISNFRQLTFFHSSVDRPNSRLEFIVANLDFPLSQWHLFLKYLEMSNSRIYKSAILKGPLRINSMLWYLYESHYINLFKVFRLCQLIYHVNYWFLPPFSWVKNRRQWKNPPVFSNYARFLTKFVELVNLVSPFAGFFCDY